MLATSSPSPSALLITGSVGAGKTSVAELVGELLAEADVPHAVIDLDWLSNTWPSPPGDRFNLAMVLRNLRNLARASMLGRFAWSWQVSSNARRSGPLSAIGVPLADCRLRVTLPVCTPG